MTNSNPDIRQNGFAASYPTGPHTSSVVTVISPPAASKLCHGSHINLHVRPRLRPFAHKKKRSTDQNFSEQDPHSQTFDQATTKSTPARHSSSSQHHPERPSKPILTPCHICYRRPTMRSQLDAYANCELCSERTCYICLRECDGPDCRAGVMDTSNSDSFQHESLGRKMCSWCAVEGVTDSGVDVVWCVDCVQREREGCQDDAWMGG
ncbi:hypothetical protein LOZ53_003353 [Ophidiomyces ophidiicola]|uniref:Uncharacterized protein n=1 Tax=Ophidiomyces ophidiicola TaxID=1387563 RepID=A0ACB8UP19_9EURO|nr:uncharacterized protein LOZ57_003683 [Ophidiomyces ophidiicola]KAI1922660.1 hypothetical protein LOZ64_001218 [Ophidiomyces ophidiicola]KAI1946428.1 hypothetical protein LOZ57_003683 [Ophidiomyces ophidiicola]KAI1949935.1 hypothetical protein LOZ62_002105 [Ophidiomyces ophidiicola]KAI1978908.1 hypothetical protein LOZ55_002421 [Ophidiomyces ophidiicola]KAI1990100.1 hypothetical protein LOZ53_003353 [Ophidiomyces ophidiicola]